MLFLRSLHFVAHPLGFASWMKMSSVVRPTVWYKTTQIEADTSVQEEPRFGRDGFWVPPRWIHKTKFVVDEPELHTFWTKLDSWKGDRRLNGKHGWNGWNPEVDFVGLQDTPPIVETASIWYSRDCNTFWAVDYSCQIYDVGRECDMPAVRTVPDPHRDPRTDHDQPALWHKDWRRLTFSHHDHHGTPLAVLDFGQAELELPSPQSRLIPEFLTDAYRCADQNKTRKTCLVAGNLAVLFGISGLSTVRNYLHSAISRNFQIRREEGSGTHRIICQPHNLGVAFNRADKAHTGLIVEIGYNPREYFDGSPLGETKFRDYLKRLGYLDLQEEQDPHPSPLYSTTQLPHTHHTAQTPSPYYPPQPLFPRQQRN